MPVSRKRKFQRKITLQGIVSYIFLALLCLLVAIGLYDWINYNHGHREFLAGNCGEAIPIFERVIPGPRFLDPAQLSVLARIERDECLIYQDALDLQRTGNYSEALIAYHQFLESHPESGLTEAIRTRTTAIFSEADSLSLANDTICYKTSSLLEQRLIPQREINLPLLYLNCAHYYDRTNQAEQAYSAYVTLLNEYPEHKAGREAEAGLINNPLSCQKPNLFRHSMIGEREDFMPKLYYSCGLNYEIAGEFEDAIQMFSSFLDEYPEHRFAGQMQDALARTLVELAKMQNAGEFQPPEKIGRADTGEAVVLILNNSPFELRIAFNGNQTIVDRLEACEDCQVFTRNAPSSCPTNIPSAQFTLQPGIYQAVTELDTPDGKLYWLGEWVLEAANTYRSCFSVIMSQQ